MRQNTLCFNKQQFFTWKNKSFPIEKLLFLQYEIKVSSARNFCFPLVKPLTHWLICLFLIYLDTFFVYKRNQ